MQTNPVTVTHQVERDDRFQPRERNLHPLSMLFHSIWGGSTGLLLGEAILGTLPWSRSLIPIALIGNLLFFPATHHNIYRIGIIACTILLGIAALPMAVALKINIYCFQVGLLCLNLLSRYAIRTDSTQELRDTIRVQIQEMRESNQKLKTTFEQIRVFIASDEQLRNKYNECLQQTADILLSPPVMHDSPPVDNPLAEEWRQESQKANYYESMKTRFNDFMSKNPEFRDLFLQKYDKQSNVSLAIVLSPSNNYS